MVAERFADEAVALARRLPGLRVGLHVVLVDGAPVSPARDVPDLLGPDGRFRKDIARLGAGIFFRSESRRQVEREITAQFERFKATGLRLDHVDAHQHFHLHPSIATIIARLAADYGARWLRVPDERLAPGGEADGGGLAHVALRPFVANLRRQARRRGLRAADRVVGFRWSGAMTKSRVLATLGNLAQGSTEIYMHPATESGFAGGARGYRYSEELQALTDADVVARIARLRAEGVTIGGFGDLELGRVS
jgi:hopanoid biosynthesis associated protein HpnK